MKQLGRTASALRDEIVALREKGKTVHEIATLTGKSARYVSRVCRENMAPIPRGRPSKVPEATIEILYKKLAANQITWAMASEHSGLSISALRRRINKFRARKKKQELERFNGKNND